MLFWLSKRIGGEKSTQNANAKKPFRLWNDKYSHIREILLHIIKE
ncbi:hypothetical protein HMPREF9148_02385 [Prevotella sp. F0091]|nr:hypothetical protein HMPREF9148_02385 [Prevotella sp. F0091]